MFGQLSTEIKKIRQSQIENQSAIQDKMSELKEEMKAVK